MSLVSLLRMRPQRVVLNSRAVTSAGESVVPFRLSLSAQRPLTLLACALLIALRLPGTVACPQFWAEDGTVFSSQQYQYGVGAIFIPMRAIFIWFHA